jgi:ABC-type cobalamin transport system permease subunit
MASCQLLGFLLTHYWYRGSFARMDWKLKLLWMALSGTVAFVLVRLLDMKTKKRKKKSRR